MAKHAGLNSFSTIWGMGMTKGLPILPVHSLWLRVRSSTVKLVFMRILATTTGRQR